MSDSIDNDIPPEAEPGDNEPGMCPACNGSGQGYGEGICLTCFGSGEERVDGDDPRNEYDPVEKMMEERE